MNITSNLRNHADSSMSIPVYEGSMLSIRSSSRILTATTNGIRYKSANVPIQKQQIEIKWKFGKLDKKYECNYCNSYLKFPIQFQECKHRVCSNCFTDLIKQSQSCPTCDKTISREKVIVDNEFQKEIHNLPVFCTNNLNGCKWEGVFKAHSMHFEECDYTLIDCVRGCGLRYQRRNERDHIANDCLKNEIDCEFCEARVIKADEATHLTHCPKFLIPCPSNCGIKEIPREKMSNHLDNECKKHEISCPFTDSGCTFKSLRGEMPKHLKESPGIHLNLICKTLSNQKKQMELISELVEKQKDQIFTLTNKVTTMEKFYGSQIIWKIDHFLEKFNDCKSGKKPTIFSPPFLTSRHGYKLALSASLYGDGKAKGKFMSLFLCICKGEFDSLLSWPFGHKISLTLLDQCVNIQDRRHVTYTIKPNTCRENMPFLGRPTSDRNASFGAQKFVELEVLNSYDYIMDDSIYIKVEVDSENMVIL
ncbi:unnamed protein product [Brachionus calyciflorus]|uniref:Uncharacterized protein n=1 Tax=Brachionus calyciflorus TaxID=104777 RepID=A0A814AEB5_9BILA|nr:unnamed protein product [Brachionus calyciflorus]